MKPVSGWMFAVGIFYILNLVILWPPVWANLLPQIYPGVDLRQDEAIFRLLLDAWVIVGLGLASIGVVLVYGARDETQFFPALFPVVMITESVFSIWDVYSAFHFEAITIAIVTLIIHGIIIASGFWIYFGLLKSSRKTIQVLWQRSNLRTLYQSLSSGTGWMKAKFKTGLEKKPANFAPLSPVSFVRRSAEAYPDAPAIIFDEQVWSWIDVFFRCRKIAGALRAAGLTADSTVAVLCRNIPAAVELSYAVPMSRSVLNMINTRLDAAAIAFILEHGEAEVFFVDSALADIAHEALLKISADPIVVCIPDPQNAGAVPGGENYEDFVEKGEPVAVDDIWPANEWDAITLNYTSGTTGNPKGVVSHHRGAYLNGLGEAIEWSMPMHARYLWTLPLFHCNGWCFPWTLAARAGVNVCMRAPEPSLAVELIRRHHVSHLCGAPIVLNMLITELSTRGEKLDPAVEIMTAGAAPPPAVLQAAESVGFDVTHVYGLTEVYGPTAICAWREEWDTLPPMQRAAYRARQGVNYTVLEELSVRDPETLREVPPDGETIGEIMFRGNVVMKGYLKNDKATKEAFSGGHFHSGDLGVRHPDGHIEIRDRSKDIIISGGENISSIEVEGVLHQHPAVAAAAVVAAPHEKWGETPAAFIELRQGACVGEDKIIAFCRENMAHFKCPTMVSFIDLPKTATGKIQKFVLRRMIVELQSGSVAKLSGIKEGGSVGKNA